MSYINIKGQVVYENLGTGIWGIIGEDGKKWQAMPMPATLQKEGLKVSAQIEELQNQASMFMWGTMVKIIDFQIEKK